MAFKLVNGTGNKLVSAQQDADLFAGIFGNTPVVLPVGERCRAEIRDANTVRVYDGEFISQGRRFNQGYGEYQDYTVENGSQGTVRYDILGFHFYMDESGNEVSETFVQKDVGENGTVTEDTIRDGATESYISMYRVKINGLSIESITPLYLVVCTVSEVNAEVEKIKASMEQQFSDLADRLVSGLKGKSDTSHNHDSRYYTESEMDSLLNGKAAKSHNHQSVLSRNGSNSFSWNWTGSVMQFYVDSVLVRTW